MPYSPRLAEKYISASGHEKRSGCSEQLEFTCRSILLQQWLAGALPGSRVTLLFSRALFTFVPELEEELDHGGRGPDPYHDRCERNRAE